MPAIADLPDLDAAMERLDAAEQAESSGATAQTHQEAEPVIPDQPGDKAEEGVSDEPIPKTTDTPEEAEKAPDGQAEKIEPKTTKTDAKTQLAKDKERRDTSWKKLNEEKQALIKEREQFQQLQTTLKQQQQRLEEQRVKAKQKVTPEQYENASGEKVRTASQLDLQADGMEARADKLEAAGDYAGAEKLRTESKAVREEASGNRYSAKQYKDMAAHLRQNPDPTEQQIVARRQQESRHYTLEAAKHWPDIAVAGSQFNATVADHLKAAAQQGIDPNEYPIMIYHAARLTAAESAASRVPDMDKELGQLRAKVKELEALTNPGGGKESAKSIPSKRQQTLEEEGSELRAMAEKRS